MKFKVINKILNNRRFDNIDYSVKDALNVLENLKNNDEEYVLKYCNRHEDNLKIENLKTTFALV